MSKNTVPLICHGEEFSSIRAFADHYGLSYPKTQYALKRGKTPEELVSSCQIRPIRDLKDHVITVNGVVFPSLADAAYSLGLPVSSVYGYVNRRKGEMPPGQAVEEYIAKREAKLEKAMLADSNLEEKQKPRNEDKRKPCIVDGQKFSSRKEAAQAFGVPLITIYSRMQRDGLSFEDALVRGRAAKTYHKPASSQFLSFQLREKEPEHCSISFAKMKSSLEFYRYLVRFFEDAATKTTVMEVNNIYVYYNGEIPGMEIISELPFSLDSDLVNLLNYRYIYTKLFTQNGKLYLSATQIFPDDTANAKPLLQAFFAFASIRDSLIRNFAQPNDASVSADIQNDGPQTEV